MSISIRTLLIEDNPIDQKLIEALLGKASGVSFALERVDRLDAGLERLAEGGIDVVLLDLELPDSSDLETCLAIRRAAPQVPLVIVTALDQEERGVEAVRHGAQDFLVKGQITRQQLVRTIRYALERVAPLANGASNDAHLGADTLQSRRDEIRKHLAALSPREREVLDLLIDGKTGKQIANRLGTSHSTVRNQRASLLAKMHAKSVAELVRALMIVGGL